MSCEGLSNEELVCKLVEVTLELDRLRAMREETGQRIGQGLAQAPDVSDEVERLPVGRRQELDNLHVHLGSEVTKRRLRDALEKALKDARNGRQ